MNAAFKTYEVEERAKADQARGFTAISFVQTHDLVMVIGGGYLEDCPNTVSVHQLKDDIWKPMKQRLNVGRSHLSACLVDTTMYAIAGRTDHGLTNSIERLPLSALQDESIPWEHIVLFEEDLKA